MQKRLVTILVALGLAGCGSAPRATPPRTALAVDRSAEVATLRTRLEQRDARVRELEAQLALLGAEARELREHAADGERAREVAAHQTVRIGRHADARDDAPLSFSDATEARVADDGPRPVLTLVGEPAPSGPQAPFVLPPPPPGLDTRLGVAPIPGDAERAARIRADVARIAALPVSALTAAGGAAPGAQAPEAVAAYRAALGLVEARRFDDAYAALTDFLSRFPAHPYADNAVYWRGEVRYAQRQYVQALHEFEDVVHRYPDGNKTPEALLKIGLCHRRMGDLARAHMFFQRVARQYPGSDAARSATQEDAS